MEEEVERRLTTILFADVAEYSRLMEKDEEGTLSSLVRCRGIIDGLICGERGRIANTAGDAVLAEFPSVADGLRCALKIGGAIGEANKDLAPQSQMRFRIGIHLGDVLVKGGDLFGDAVNIAARLAALAEPGGICASSAVREHAGARALAAFDDAGIERLKNIAEPVHVFRVGPRASGPHAAGTAAVPALPLPEKPSIAVLPFQNLSGDPEQEYFADGMVEEIITALSRIRWLFVIARNSSFTYKGQSVDVKRVGRELGVRYVLEGSVRKAGQRVRITGQLIDAETGAHLWADHFDGSLEDVFDLQDRVAISVAGVIEPALRAAESRRAAVRPTNDLGAYDLFLRALPIMYRLSKENLAEAASLLEQAIARDPQYGAALAFASICHMRLAVDGWSKDPDASRETAVSFARRALEAAGDDPATLANAAFTLAYLGEDIAAMTAVVDRALALNPSYARGWYVSGILRVIAGQPDLAIEHVEKSLRLSPRDVLGVPTVVIGAAHLFGRRLELAAENFRLAIRQAPAYPWAYLHAAACYAHLGRLDEAREVIAQLRAIGAEVIPSRIMSPFPREVRELLLSGLRMAMGEET